MEVNWISVKDRLPESFKEVLAFSKNKGVNTGFISNGYFYMKGFDPEDITHWMPFPDKPVI